MKDKMQFESEHPLSNLQETKSEIRVDLLVDALPAGQDVLLKDQICSNCWQSTVCLQMAGRYKLGNEVSLHAPDLQREDMYHEGCM